jgi:hypothetical protein
MAEHLEDTGQAPPAGEAIHLPGPSYLPVIIAVGTTITLVGVVLNWAVFGLGLLITLIAIFRWIGQARTELADLPLEHHS